MASLSQDDLRILAEEQEKQLRQQRRNFTVALRLRKGPFWQEIRSIRERWHIEPVPTVPSEDLLFHWFGISLHLPLHIFPTDSELAGSDDWRTVYRDILIHLSDWEGDVRGAYQRLIPPDERRSDRLIPGTFEQFASLPRVEGLKAAGDKYTVHWAPFISGCALFNPPQDPDHLDAFADHIQWDPATLELSERDRLRGEAPRVEPPSVRFMASAEDRLRTLEEEYGELHARLALRPELEAVGFRRILLEELARLPSLSADPSPIEAMLDPRTAPNRGVLWVARRVVAPTLPSAGAPEKYDDLVALRCYELRQRGLKIPEIARRMELPLQKDEHGELRRSKSVQDLLRRGERITSG